MNENERLIFTAMREMQAKGFNNRVIIRWLLNNLKQSREVNLDRLIDKLRD